MIEARKGQIVIFLTEFGELEGTIGEVLKDRIFVHYYSQDKALIAKLKDGTYVKTLVHTRSGIKKMYPIIIEKDNDFIIIENAPAIPEKQNRDNVRIICEQEILIKLNKDDENSRSAKTLDISAGGIKFEIENCKLEINDTILVQFNNKNLPHENLNAKILKSYSDKIFVAQFFDNNVNIINSISKFCMNNFD